MNPTNYKECEPVFGFNTKQWWVYDNENDRYIDPPTEVLNELKRYFRERQEEKFIEIITTNPDWLQDSDYWYDAEETEI